MFHLFTGKRVGFAEESEFRVKANEDTDLVLPCATWLTLPTVTGSEGES